MSILLFLVLSLSVVGLSMLAHATFSAPFGEEDSDGFHFSAPQDSRDADSPSRILTEAELDFFKP